MLYNQVMAQRTRFYESHHRSITKSIIFRLVVICSDTAVIYFLTHRVALTLGLTLATNLASTLIYYLYERIWNQIDWGRKTTGK
jgi:uncharacterized membrane protein